VIAMTTNGVGLDRLLRRWPQPAWTGSM